MDLERDAWAREQLWTAELGDERRVRRARKILAELVDRPGGRISDVVVDAAARQAAYDFVEGCVRPEALVSAFADATLRAGASQSFLYVAIDGSSLTLTDRAGAKGFGSIGPRAFPTRGLKVITALAIEPNGAPLGLIDMQFWARKERATDGRARRRRTMTTETRHWLDVIDGVQERMAAHTIQPWVLIDREGDSGDMLRALERGGARFTVRSNQNRRLAGRDRRLRTAAKRHPSVGQHMVDLTMDDVDIAVLDIRVGRVVLDLPDYTAGARRRTNFTVNVVSVRECDAPDHRAALDWMLLMNTDVATLEDARAVIDGYSYRWRIEEFHRTWKKGHCRVEETQLRHRDHVVRWATMHAAVATRAERLKHLARTSPHEPATVGFSEIEVVALRIRKRQIKKRTETISDDMPTIATAVRWLAETGGFQGKSTENPGSITIGRGLERLKPFVLGLEAGLKLARR